MFNEYLSINLVGAPEVVLSSKPTRNHLEVINDLMEEAIPGVGERDFRFVEHEVEMSDLNLSMNGCQIAFAENKIFTAFHPLMVGRVRSQMGGKKPNTMKQNLLCYDSRNANPPPPNPFASDEIGSDLLLSSFVKNFLDADLLSMFLQDRVSVSLSELGDWLESRTPDKYSSIKKRSEPFFSLPDKIKSFKVMVKDEPKPKLDDSVLSKYVVGQNIVYQSQEVNVLYSHVFQQLQTVITLCLKSNISLFNRVDTDSYAELVQANLRFPLGDYRCLELDFSKFDKSQHRMFKLFEEKIYRYFGMDEELLELWSYCESVVLGSTHDKTVKFEFSHQRRTGASNTWLGNTLVTLGILSYYYGNDFKGLLCVAGDDSLMLSEQHLENRVDEINRDLGFECKFLIDALPYFCSRIFYDCGGQVRFIPDPYKLLVKLGRRTRAIDENIESVFISLADCCKHINNQATVEYLALCISLRYGVSFEAAERAISVINVLKSNPSQFKRLFE